MSATAQRLKVGAWFVCLWLAWASSRDRISSCADSVTTFGRAAM